MKNVIFIYIYIFIPINTANNPLLIVYLPSYLQSWLCGIHRPCKASVFSDVGQGHHAVVVGDKDDINGGKVQQFSL